MVTRAKEAKIKLHGSLSMDQLSSNYYYENTLQAVANCLEDEDFSENLRRNSIGCFDPNPLKIIQEEEDYQENVRCLDDSIFSNSLAMKDQSLWKKVIWN